MKFNRQSTIRTVLLLFVSVLAFSPAAPAQQKAAAGEKRNDFAQLVSRLSEKAGYFGSDNLVSNELTYQHVLGKLAEDKVTGGVYLGVGPDQNFTYIAQIKPKLAIMIDIRRDALLQHLMFKALFMMSRTRVEYLSNLFARPLPKDYKKWNDRPIRDLVDYYDRTPLDQKMADKIKLDMHKRVEAFGLGLNQRDWETIDEIYQAFYTDCLEVRYTIRDRPTGRFFPAYRDLLLEKDLNGKYRNYLAREADFLVIKTMHDQNRIIPATGDVAGVKAVKAIGDFVKEIGEKVSAFYLSNVEFYLFRQDSMGRFVENLKALPVDDRSVIIRSYFNYAYYTNIHPQTIDNYFSVQLLQPIEALIKGYDAGEFSSYYELTTRGSLELKP